MLIDTYQAAVDTLLRRVRDTQRENIIKAGELVAETVASGGNVYLGGIVHGIEMDLISRGGGPLFYKPFRTLGDPTNGRKRELTEEEKKLIEEGKDPSVPFLKSNLRPGDLLFVSSVSGRTVSVVNLAYDAMQYGVKVIALMSMDYAGAVEPVHASGKKLFEFVTLTLDNCAPPAEGMLEVAGIEAPFAAASGIASDYIMWSLTSVAVESLLRRGIAPGIHKSANYPGGADYNNNVLVPQYEKSGW